jgi:hypothetical protein
MPYRIKHFRLAGMVAFAFSIMLAALPAFAGHSSTAHHTWADPAAKAYIHNGLPCSTASLPGPAVIKSESGLRELDQIARSSLTAIKPSSGRPGVGPAVYRPAVYRRSEKSTPISFAYHAPVRGGAEGGRSWSSARRH